MNMSTTISTTVVNNKASTTNHGTGSSSVHSMFDSGFSSTSLRLTLHEESAGSQSSSIMASSINSESNPVVSMPGGATSLSVPPRESGLASELNRLSLSFVQPSASLPTPDEAWKEYYEQDDDGDVQLHLAIASGYVEVVDSLIRMAPDAGYLNIQNNQMYAPLHIAVLRNHPAIVRRLVIAGARIDIHDHEGNTPLHLAARRGHVECGEALLQPVAIHEMSPLSADRPSVHHLPQADIVDMANYQGENPVHLATMGGHVNFLQFLSWNNADMNAQEGRAGRTPLHFAIGSGNLATIQCLLEPKPTGCGVNPNLIDWYGRTPYQVSLINGSNEVTHYLSRRAGIDLSGVDSDDSIEDSDSICGENRAVMNSLLLNPNA